MNSQLDCMTEGMHQGGVVATILELHYLKSNEIQPTAFVDGVRKNGGL